MPDDVTEREGEPVVILSEAPQILAQTILDTLREPVLVLDGALRVKMANRSFYRTFRVKPKGTENKLIYELRDGQWNIPKLRLLLKEICFGKTEVEDFEIERDFAGIGRRLMVLNARRLQPETGQPMILLAIEDMRDATERNRAEKALRGLSARLLQLQDEVRRRIARELHDAIGQNLVALVMNLTSARQSVDRTNPKARKALSGSLAVAERCLKEMRTLSYLLHPPLLDEDGLASALAWYVNGFAERSGIKIDLKVSPNFGRLSQEIETTLFRVVQEGLTNVHRHAKSPIARIRLSWRLTGVELEIKDKGHGMPMKTRRAGIQKGAQLGVGIMGMRERASQLGGRLEIHSSHRGTTVRIVIPHPEVDK